MRILTGFELYQKLGQTRETFLNLVHTKPKHRLGVSKNLGDVIWLHVAEPDQLKEFAEVIRQIREVHSALKIVATCETGLRGILVDGIDEYLKLPLEKPSDINVFLNGMNPKVAIWNANHMRPILIGRAAKRAIPMIYTNAEVTEKTLKSFWLIRQFYGAYLTKFHRILSKSDEAAKAFRRTNAPRQKLEVVGELRAGGIALPYQEEHRAALAARIGSRPVWLATHVQLAELAHLGKAQRRVSRVAQRLLLVLHLSDPEMIGPAMLRLSAMGFKTGRSGQDDIGDCDIWFPDSETELGTLYRLAPVSFLGSSLSTDGGCDPLAAAALGSAIVAGPHISNFRDSYARLADVRGAVIVQNSEQLASQLTKMMSPDIAAEMAHAAWVVCSAGAEVSDRLLELIDEILTQKS